MFTSVAAGAAAQILQADAQKVIDEINIFTRESFKTRGGRLGSGMGSLLEALWVYYMNKVLQNEGGLARECEIAWMEDHEPADFACLYRGAEWKASTRQGELFRIEAKSMNIGVDEAKGHFTNLAKETHEHDQLLVLLWSWTGLENEYSWPRIHDYFLGPSLPIIHIRDELHLQRGGCFVKSDRCPDGCAVADCTHEEEPLNASGKRERRSGPQSSKPANVDYAANFGGLLRMLKTNNDGARHIFRKLRKEDDIVHRYVSFIHKHYQSEEINQYKKSEWLSVLKAYNISVKNPSSSEANDLLRRMAPNYREYLREIL